MAECLRHCQQLQTFADIRAQERTSKREATKAKSCDSFHWLSSVLSGNVSSLIVYELDKYNEKYDLSKKGKNLDKVKAISCHV